MGKPIRTSLVELLEKPEKYLGREVEVTGIIKFIGKSPRVQTYSENLPREDYCISILKSGDREILCYGLERLCFDEYNNKKVKIIGFFAKLHNNFIIKAVYVELLEE